MATFPRGHNARTTRAHNERLTITAADTTSTMPGKVTWFITASDTITLRGIPAIGRGVAGHIPHTRPDTHTLDEQPTPKAQS